MTNLDGAIGMWFLPESPDDVLSGTISIDEKGRCNLRVAHNFGGIKGIGKYDKVESIQGFLANGKKVTLINCVRTKQQWGFPGFPDTIYTSSMAVIGGWYKSDEEIFVSEIAAAYEYLNYWINDRPFRIVPNDEKKEILVIYRMPQIVSCDIGGQVIELTYKTNSKSDSYSNFEIQQSEYVCFKFSDKVHFKDAFDSVNDFANFLTLCIGKSISATSTTAKNQEGQEIEFIYARNIDETQVVKEHDLYIRFTEIKDIFENSMKSWQGKKERLKPIIWYFVEAHEKEFSIPMSFLKIVQAMEAYSRRMRRNEILPQDEFEKKCDLIIEKIENDEDKNLVRSLLSNEPRLRQRLTELFEETNFILDITSKKRKSFINKIVDTRNYFTHFDPSLEKKILKPIEMYNLSRLMKLILRVLLMQEFGLSQEQIKLITEDNQELIYIKEGLGLTPPVKLFDFKDVPADKEEAFPPKNDNGV